MKIESLNLDLKHVLGAECVWHNGEMSKDDVLDKFSFILNSENVLFENIKLDRKCSVAVDCDYYGGLGTGSNIGSGRSVVLGRHILKGVGRTPLSGETKSLYNSSGVYPLYEGITETIIQRIFKKILPINTIEHVAIIYIGKSKYYSTSHNEFSLLEGEQDLALLVRKATTRVGHYIRAYNPKPRELVKYTVKDDIARVKRNIEALEAIGPEKVFYNFAENCAKQFAFGRVFRVAHGALTHSNISIYGEWLDLTNTTAVPDDHNGHAGFGDVLFLDEKLYIEEVLTEWIYTYNKYSNAKVDVKSYIDLYRLQYESYFSLYVHFYLGLNIQVRDVNNPISRQLSAYFKTLVDGAAKTIVGVPREQLSFDKQENFVRDVFKSAISVGTPINKLYHQCFVHNNDHFDDFRLYCIGCSIRSLKSIHLRQMLYIGRIYLYAREIVGSRDIIQERIDDVSRVGDWFLLKDVIFMNESTKLIFFGKIFILQYNHKEVSFSETESLLNYIFLNDDVDFNFAFRSYRENVINILNKISEIFYR